MKSLSALSVLTLTLVLSLGVVGCAKNPKGPTPIPKLGSRVGPGGPGGLIDPGNAAALNNNPSSADLSGGGIRQPNLEEFDGMQAIREQFSAFTVYFDYDRSSVKSSEKSKVEEVANYFRQNRTDKLLIEGHCDERGTEEYNRALGERRAASVREYLVNLGVSPDRIRTISYGEDRPAVQGSTDSAWSQNRRGEFVLLKPKP